MSKRDTYLPARDTAKPPRSDIVEAARFLQSAARSFLAERDPASHVDEAVANWLRIRSLAAAPTPPTPPTLPRDHYIREALEEMATVPRGHCDRCDRCGWEFDRQGRACRPGDCSMRPLPELRSACAGCGAPFSPTPPTGMELRFMDGERVARRDLEERVGTIRYAYVDDVVGVEWDDERGHIRPVHRTNLVAEPTHLPGEGTK